jgi:hypothetical protein
VFGSDVYFGFGPGRDKVAGAGVVFPFRLCIIQHM